MKGVRTMEDLKKTYQEYLDELKQALKAGNKNEAKLFAIALREFFKKLSETEKTQERADADVTFEINSSFRHDFDDKITGMEVMSHLTRMGIDTGYLPPGTTIKFS